MLEHQVELLGTLTYFMQTDLWAFESL